MKKGLPRAMFCMVFISSSETADRRKASLISPAEASSERADRFSSVMEEVAAVAEESAAEDAAAADAAARLIKSSIAVFLTPLRVAIIMHRRLQTVDDFSSTISVFSSIRSASSIIMTAGSFFRLSYIYFMVSLAPDSIGVGTLLCFAIWRISDFSTSVPNFAVARNTAAFCRYRSVYKAPSSAVLPMPWSPCTIIMRLSIVFVIVWS